jgi:ribosome maturation factor RimP
MPKKTVVDIVTELALPIIEKNKFELVDVEFIKEGANWYLRVYIDKPGGVTLDDCQVVSQELSDKIDKVDPIKQSYFLEVSSPGLERALKKDRDFERHKGALVEVRVYKPICGKKIFEGELIGLEDNKIKIKIEDKEVLELKRDEVSLIKTVVRF